jgi:NAD(P)H dehydrogenase (quinone)
MAQVLVIYAHPEPRSLNGSLKDVILRSLEELGHKIEVSDLYEMKWKAVVDAADFQNFDSNNRLQVTAASRRAFEAGEQTPDVAAEQQKLRWADAVVFQFPLWWSGPPAIFKGWIDRVFGNGFGYGIGSYEGPRRARRYGDGTLVGKRALVSVTGGGHAAHYSQRGIKGGGVPDVLWPFMHGLLWYTGMDVLQPVTLLSADRTSEAEFADHADLLRARLQTLMTAPRIPYRLGNSGDYDDDLCLKDGLEGGSTGLAIHRSVDLVKDIGV